MNSWRLAQNYSAGSNVLSVCHELRRLLPQQHLHNRQQHAFRDSKICSDLLDLASLLDIVDGFQLFFLGQSLVCTSKCYLNSSAQTKMNIEAVDT